MGGEWAATFFEKNWQALSNWLWRAERLSREEFLEPPGEIAAFLDGIPAQKSAGAMGIARGGHIGGIPEPIPVFRHGDDRTTRYSFNVGQGLGSGISWAHRPQRDGWHAPAELRQGGIERAAGDCRIQHHLNLSKIRGRASIAGHRGFIVSATGASGD